MLDPAQWLENKGGGTSTRGFVQRRTGSHERACRAATRF